MDGAERVNMGQPFFLIESDRHLERTMSSFSGLKREILARKLMKPYETHGFSPSKRKIVP